MYGQYKCITCVRSTIRLHKLVPWDSCVAINELTGRRGRKQPFSLGHLSLAFCDRKPTFLLSCNRGRRAGEYISRARLHVYIGYESVTTHRRDSPEARFVGYNTILRDIVVSTQTPPLHDHIAKHKCSRILSATSLSFPRSL